LQKKCKESVIQLNVTRQELLIWEKASRFIELDKKVKSSCEDRTEGEYLSYLMEVVKKQEEKLSRMQAKQATIKTLFRNVTSELSNVSQYIDSINEPWGELLKRTIVNSRFSTGDLLKSSTIRNKPTAEIAAMLNGHNIPVNRIASEAQLTDLQLTFMLAMAKQHHWTPWRALLLDDPTQHHDLVHASSVFDLLRDYISDFDFQLMLSTHDSQQANFFRRKLENDGIENKVYKLKVGNDGVFADLI
jgi:exonuclease SbcC